MTDIHRRAALKLLGAAAVSTAAPSAAAASTSQTTTTESDGESDGADRQPVGEIFKLGHAVGSDPEGGYAEEDVREDGEMALLSSFLGEGGTFL